MKSILFFAIIVMYISCNVRDKKGSTSFAEESIVEEQIDVPSNSKIIEIPKGFTTGDITSFVPRNQEEQNFMNDMEMFIQANIRKDYKTVLSMAYPDYWKEIQKQMPDKSIDEIKERVEKVYPEMVEARNKKILSAWKEAIYTREYITDIKNRVQEGRNILYLYECYNLLFSETDSIKELEPTYCIAASIDGGERWYSVPSEGFYSLLGYRFSEKAINDVQKVK